MKFIFIFFFILLTSKINANTAVVGRVSSLDCKEKISTLWISDIESSQLLYQTDVPLKSSFKVHLIPGKYKFVLNNSDGCLAEENIEISKNDTMLKKEFFLKKK